MTGAIDADTLAAEIGRLAAADRRDQPAGWHALTADARRSILAGEFDGLADPLVCRWAEYVAVVADRLAGQLPVPMSDAAARASTAGLLAYDNAAARRRARGLRVNDDWVAVAVLNYARDVDRDAGHGEWASTATAFVAAHRGRRDGVRHHVERIVWTPTEAVP